MSDIDNSVEPESLDNGKIYIDEEKFLDLYNQLSVFNPETKISTLQTKFLTPETQISKDELSLYQRYQSDPSLQTLDFYLKSQQLLAPSNPNPLGTGQLPRFGIDSLITDLTFIRQINDSGEIVLAPISSAKTSTGLNSVGKDYLKGSLNKVPYLPDDINKVADDIIEDEMELEELMKSLDDLDHINLPPADGLDRKLLLDEVDLDLSLFNELNSKEVDDLELLWQLDQPDINELLEEEEKQEKDVEVKQEVDELIPDNFNLISEAEAVVQDVGGKQWANEVKLDRLPNDYNEVVKDMAHKFPFELDNFQKQGVYRLERGESIFVAAHTSAGKTVLAEYAIALSQLHMTRTIYTSPIKALSNQKYRDFLGTFDSIGILTGDVQINPEASCLIMTTEILRSMLYRGADVIRDVEFVIFDEVHYLNDSERGVVWEEVIIMLPQHVTLILLSATVPNTLEFAEWIGRTKCKDIYVISTLQRPTPLVHHIYANNELFKIVDQNRSFIEPGWKAARDSLTKVDTKKPTPSANQRGRGTVARGGPNRNATSNAHGNPGYSRFGDKQQQTLWVHMVGYLKKQKLLPVIIFTFSKRRCDSNALSLTNIELTNHTEKSEIQVFLNFAFKKLSPDDRNLPQIRMIIGLLRRGIGVHHSGLLPIVKEVVEILFSKGLVKVLFATETFAMGVNMPARSVVFNSIKKHDGTELRYLLSGEYTQMSGRAGRRGIDKVGMVILACPDNQIPDMATLKHMILGKSNKLQSQFRLTFNMMVNLLRVEALKVEDMIKRSFMEDYTQQLVPKQQEELDKLANEITGLVKLDCSICEVDVDVFLNQDLKAKHLSEKIYSELASGPGNKQVFGQGRVVVIDNHRVRNGLALLIKSVVSSSKAMLSNQRSSSSKSYLCLVIYNKASQMIHHPIIKLNIGNKDKLEHKLMEVEVSDIIAITDHIVEFDMAKVMASDKKGISDVIDELMEIEKDWNVNKVSQIQVPKANRSVELHDDYSTRQQLIIQLLTSYQCVRCPDSVAHYHYAYTAHQLRFQHQALAETIKGINLELIPEFHNRMSVLRDLNFTDGVTITLKGRVACEINSINELVVTELIMDNFFGDLPPEEIVALLSCFVFQERNDDSRFDPLNPSHIAQYLNPNLVLKCQQMIDTVSTILTIQHIHNVNLEHDSPYSQLNFGLVHVIYHWANNMSFNHVTEITDIAEGSIVRAITRLDDSCRDLRNAARLIGDFDLFDKMELAREKIKRDIVFAQSLYF